MSSKTPYKVLCVCLGNICRSPTAEIVLRHFCDEQQLNVLVDSAGTSNYHPFFECIYLGICHQSVGTKATG